MGNNALKAIGVLPWRSLDLDEAGGAEVIKGTPGLLFSLVVTNRTTAPQYVKLYDAATAVVGTDTPVATYCIPANASDYVLVGLNFGGRGLYFNVGICIGASGAFADNDTTTVATNGLIAVATYF